MKDTLPLRVFVYNNVSEGRNDHAAFMAHGAERLGAAFVHDVILYKAFYQAVLAVWKKDHKPLSGELYKCNKAALAFVGRSFSPDEMVRFVLPATYWSHVKDPKSKYTENAWIHLYRRPIPETAVEISTVWDVPKGPIITSYGGY